MTYQSIAVNSLFVVVVVVVDLKPTSVRGKSVLYKFFFASFLCVELYLNDYSTVSSVFISLQSLDATIGIREYTI